MKASYLVTLLLASLVPVVGCRALSNAAFSLGHALDPATARCTTVPNCPLCGDDPMGQPYGGGPGATQYPACPHCGHAPAPTPGLASQVPVSIEQPGPQPIVRSSAVEEELARRNAELIQSRGDFLRVQEQINQVRQDMIAWQNETKQIHSRLQDRDRRRRDALDRMNHTLATIAEESSR